MPPTFLYLLGFGAWLCLAFIVWLASACLAVPRLTRRIAGPMASAMACTFPAVIAFQLAALPLAAIIMAVALAATRLIDPSNSPETADPAVIGIGMTLVAMEFAVIGGMSLLGFWEGWRAGWMIATGHGLRSAVAQGPTARILKAFKRRR